ncbi:glycosyltransferase [Microbacterium sp. X-17]|uniref:glycosyltransferase n=1 Tax=Microbacterium sp. X-17 TaxID=3144404 RepID=UPI0031F4C172
MPARVHALLVVRPDSRTPAAAHLKRTLAALRAQTRPVDALTIVLCGRDAETSALAAASGAEGVISAAPGTRFAQALQLASPRIQGDAVWLLAQDTAPDPDALAHLAGALELAPSAALVAPKLVSWRDRTRILSLGVTMTRYGRRVGLADGELDQGQHDAEEDALGSDIRGVLMRTDVWRSVDGLDPALAGADEGLDLGVRAWLAGFRVELEPDARVAAAGDGVAELPEATSRGRVRRAAYAGRVAQLHRRLAYAPAATVPLHWLTLLPLALWRTIVHLLGKQPARILPDWGASVAVAVRWGAIARSRRRIRRARRVSWSRLAPLRATGRDERERLAADDVEHAGDPVRTDLRFFSGGGAWAVLGALVVSVAALPTLLAWPVLDGGALAPLRSTVTQLWTDAVYGLRPLGLDATAPAAPFSAIVAAIGSLWPWAPSRALVILWLLALPLAVLGAWFAATRVSERSLVRITVAVAWALAPPFLAALTEGRPTEVLVHLLLPWLFYAGSVAHRSWSSSGAASLLLVAVLACAPSLGPALVLVWLAAIVLAILVRAGRGVGHLVWVVVPAVVIAVPVVWAQLRAQNPWGLLADPGVTIAGPAAPAGAAGRLLLAAGFPDADPGGWGTFLTTWFGSPVTWWVPLLVAPIAVLALASLITPRWGAGGVLLFVAGTGVVTAFAASGIQVAAAAGAAVPLLTGPGLSLAWAGAVGAAAVTLDVAFPREFAPLRIASATLAIVALTVLAIPALTATARGVSPLAQGTGSTLPAYVAAQATDDTATLVLQPVGEGRLAAQVVWGPSLTLGGPSTVVDSRRTDSAADAAVASIAANLVSSTAQAAVAQAADAGIAFVLLAPPQPGESDDARVFRLSAATSLDQQNGLDAVGETAKGDLWRVTTAVTPRAPEPEGTAALAQTIAVVQLLVVAAALLLAIPNGASRREARRTPRVVGGRMPEEDV